MAGHLGQFPGRQLQKLRRQCEAKGTEELTLISKGLGFG